MSMGYVEVQELTCCGGRYNQKTHPACTRCDILFGPDHAQEHKYGLCLYCLDLSRREKTLTQRELSALNNLRHYGVCPHDAQFSPKHRFTEAAPQSCSKCVIPPLKMSMVEQGLRAAAKLRGA